MDEQTKYERFFVRSSMVLEKKETVSEEENRLFFFFLFVIQKERSFAHFIFIKWVGGVCVKQIDTIQRG
ncbi:hypothetical protein [Lactococcus lactis]|uniref:hypothetical protein n=1 Tax=Lactococcus lactis TaxID=1358 RepID=UPI00168B1611|nr:hypothetical protein [Lactococcus lactis]QNT13120.1 hypothetical protein HPC60_13890 [Lactococcus lactis subsp. lactis]